MEKLTLFGHSPCTAISATAGTRLMLGVAGPPRDPFAVGEAVAVRLPADRCLLVR